MDVTTALEQWLKDTKVQLHSKVTQQDAVRWLNDNIQLLFIQVIIPSILRYIQNSDATNPDEAGDCLLKALCFLHDSSQVCEHAIAALPTESRFIAISNLDSQRRVALMRDQPQLNKLLFSYCWKSFSSYCDSKAAAEEDAEPEEDETFYRFCGLLRDLKVLSICEQVITEVVFAYTEKKLLNECTGDFGTAQLPLALEWVRNVATNWLAIVFGTDSRYAAAFEQWKLRLDFFVYETVGRIRISELFDIIVDFPDSTTALEDIKQCLLKTRQFNVLVSSLKSAFQKRLLHPGASTLQILTIYVSTIKALRFLDPSGVLLDNATSDVRQYLRQRSDTLRCIVSAFTDETSPLSSLFEELAKFVPLPHPSSSNSQTVPASSSESGAVQSDHEDGDSEDEDEESYLKWNPKPVAAQPDGELSLHKPPDTISTLVQVYGSRELFAKEYTSMLAERLLSMTDFNTEKEVRNVELLKLKFGEASLHNCEIMLKDMADSKRINGYIRNELSPLYNGDFPFSATIVSYLFWPNQFKQDGDMVLPASIKSQMEQFTAKYAALKASRKLQWQSKIGVVELDLEIGGRVLSFSVSPVHANVIMLFEEKDAWTVSDVANRLEIPEDVAKNRLTFWVRHGLLREAGGNTFEVVESTTDVDLNDEAEEDVDEGPTEEESDESFEPFVMAMLTNLGSLPLARVHQMLTAVVPGYEDRTIQQTSALLHRMVQEDKIEHANGEYSLKK